MAIYRARCCSVVQLGHVTTQTYITSPHLTSQTTFAYWLTMGPVELCLPAWVTCALGLSRASALSTWSAKVELSQVNH